MFALVMLRKMNLLMVTWRTVVRLGMGNVGVGELVQGGHQRQEGGQQQQQGEGGGAHGGASVSAGELRRSEESGPSPTFIQTPQHRGGETRDRVQAAMRLGDL